MPLAVFEPVIQVFQDCKRCGRNIGSAFLLESFISCIGVV